MTLQNRILKLTSLPRFALTKLMPIPAALIDSRKTIALKCKKSGSKLLLRNLLNYSMIVHTGRSCWTCWSAQIFYPHLCCHQKTSNLHSAWTQLDGHPESSSFLCQWKPEVPPNISVQQCDQKRWAWSNMCPFKDRISKEYQNSTWFSSCMLPVSTLECDLIFELYYTY